MGDKYVFEQLMHDITLEIERENAQDDCEGVPIDQADDYAALYHDFIQLYIQNYYGCRPTIVPYRVHFS
eukprot:COSAG01_NODE_5176_length_4432_cov_5.631202_5_plen_69_part_00